jgi:hypothetical protein
MFQLLNFVRKTTLKVQLFETTAMVLTGRKRLAQK